MARSETRKQIRDWVSRQPWAQGVQGKGNEFPEGRKCSQCPKTLPQNLKDVCSGECYVKKIEKESGDETKIDPMPP